MFSPYERSKGFRKARVLNKNRPKPKYGLKETQIPYLPFIVPSHHIFLKGGKDFSLANLFPNANVVIMGLGVFPPFFEILYAATGAVIVVSSRIKLIQSIIGDGLVFSMPQNVQCSVGGSKLEPVGTMNEEKIAYYRRLGAMIDDN